LGASTDDIILTPASSEQVEIPDAALNVGGLVDVDHNALPMWVRLLRKARYLLITMYIGRS
jgi:hypothetical protein